jgi:hypothetical protein
MSPKAQKIVIATSIIGAVALVAGAIILRQRRKNKDREKALLATAPNVGAINDSPVGPLIEWPLKVGAGYLSQTDRNAVMTVQSYLNLKIQESDTYILPLLDVDGRFGYATQNALVRIAGVKQVSYTLHNTMEAYLKTNKPSSYYSNRLSTNTE